MPFKNLLLEIEDGIAILTLNRPKVMNALSAELMHEFRDAIHQLEEDKNVKVIILTGAGDRAFVAGADISELKEMNSFSALEYSKVGHDCFAFMEKMSKPIIAAVNGFALGGGAELACACDFIFASEKAKFGLPEINLGVIPGFGGTQRLPRLIGKAIAKELIYTGDIIDAQRAYELGLVNKVFSLEDLITETKKIAQKIADKGSLAIKSARDVINKGTEVDLKAGCEIEMKTFSLLMESEDAKEGMNAFIEKRKATFTGK
ncbi:MAG: enoyl-CoA hydratase-related protein [Thermodesulfobacteriota bacterium]|nr:enoyl-CoA hydratase-related protein [Thermodesulfobacteriota bacterium]